MTFDIEAHNDLVNKMNAFYERTGRWQDPLTGVDLPNGVRLVKNPNRAQRRALESWRRKNR